MNPVYYEVTATLHDNAIADEWVRWMISEHIPQVREAGAISGRLLRIDNSASCFVAQYEFASSSALDRYLTTHATRLRAAGEERFEHQQVSYARKTGEIIAV